MVIPQDYHGIKPCSYSVKIKKQIYLRAVRLLEFAFKMNVQIRLGLRDKSDSQSEGSVRFSPKNRWESQSKG